MDVISVSLCLFRLLTERAMACRSECSAIISAIMECLQFTVSQNIGEEAEDMKIQEMLIDDQVCCYEYLKTGLCLDRF